MKFYALSLLTTVMLLITGCGGGSGGESFTHSLTLNGIVTDGPIENATVTATVGSTMFIADAPTDANGAYSITIGTNNDNDLIELTAVEPNNQIELVALLGRFSTVNLSSDSNGILDGVNITHFSTASYAALVNAAADDSVDNAEEYEQLLEDNGAFNIASIAAALRIVIDNVDGIIMPAEFESTLDFALALASGETSFLTDLNASNPGLVFSTIGDLADEGGVGFDPDEYWPGIYTFSGSYFAEPGFDVAGLTPTDDGVIALSINGTGYHYTNFIEDATEKVVQRATPLTWSINESKQLILMIGDPAYYQETYTLFSYAQMPSNYYRSNNFATFRQSEFISSNNSGSSEMSLDYYRYGGTDSNGVEIPGSYLRQPDRGANEYLVFANNNSGYSLNGDTGEMFDMFAWMATSTFSAAVDFEPMVNGSIHNYSQVAAFSDGRLFVQNIINDVDDNELDRELIEFIYTNVIYDGPVSAISSDTN